MQSLEPHNEVSQPHETPKTESILHQTGDLSEQPLHDKMFQEDVVSKAEPTEIHLNASSIPSFESYAQPLFIPNTQSLYLTSQ